MAGRQATGHMKLMYMTACSAVAREIVPMNHPLPRPLLARHLLLRTGSRSPQQVRLAEGMVPGRFSISNSRSKTQ